jgi:hypothetical protein
MADFRPTVKKHAINERKLQLHTPNASGKNATLKFNIVKNYPRIDVYTNDDNDAKNKEPIRAAMDQPCFFLFLTLLEKAANSKESFEETIENKNYTFFGGKRSEKPEVISRVTVGKDEKGVIFITVSAKNRPKIKFPLAPTNWNYLIDIKTGEKIGEAKASHYTALAWKEMLSQMIGSYLVFNFEEEEVKEQKSNQGGNNRWQQNNQSNSSSSYSSDEDELPF